ncbi:legumain-like [Oppia nitens]|uniref:legumain-like n=1 Tax=Oppia nitens TaxID=1686743 RepID=UPI0023DB7D3D|nr:legumain-like [Oppia nitens]
MLTERQLLANSVNADDCYRKFVETVNDKSYTTVPLANSPTPLVNGSNNWVVLAAGSKGWSNYADQSMIYRAYHMFRSYGIPDDHIIMFHYDDIANDTHNPTPGIVINVPDGPDVYHGVPKDYTGNDVTPENYLAVLKGDPGLVKKGRKVLKSGPMDNIFLWFGDHGLPGVVLFPSSYLHYTDLNNALIYMYENKRYANLVIYIDTCLSAADLEHRTLDQQWHRLNRTDVIDETRGLTPEHPGHQHPQRYGNLSMGSKHLSDFFGN